MNKITLSSLAGLALALSGCASLAPPLEMPAIPAPKTDLIDARLNVSTKSKLADNAVQLGTHRIAPNSSIVINVPDTLFERESESKSGEQEFKTKDFFSDAEQQIERVLIKNGFRVLSRSKFEAKLRTLRDEARCNLSQYSCLYSQVAPEARPILDDLKLKFERNVIDAAQYADEIKKFRDKLQTASAGKKRGEGEKELTDISEVIRAAESGDVQANYILQINKFDTNQRLKVKLDLNHQPTIRDFIRNHPEIESEFNSGANREISCAMVGATLNAKLVDVKTGEIVWIGDHQLDEFSAGVNTLTIEMGARRFVANEQEIRRFVANNNTEAARQARSGMDVRVPALVYRSVLVKPTVASGRCEQKWAISDEEKGNLVRQVARELISTIKVASAN